MNSTYGNSIGTLRKGGVTVAIVAAAFALAVALGMAAPAQAVAAQGSNELAAGSAQVATQGDFAMANPEWTSIWAGDTAYTGLWQYTNGITDGIQITKVTSSNSAVLKVKKLDSYKQLSSYEVYPLKAGKAKLSVTYKQNGATKTISETYTVKTFTNGFKSIKLNGESLTVPTSKKADSSGRYYCFTGTSAKVNVTTANGWEIDSISGYFYNSKNYNANTTNNFTITNGKAFTIPKNYEGNVSIGLYNSETEDYYYYNLYIYRSKPIELSKATYSVGYPKSSAPRIGSMHVNAKDIKVISVTSSKPAVIKAKKNANFDKVRLTPKKEGTTEITIKYKLDGKTYTTSAKCTVAKYPFKSVKINGKAVSLKKFPYGKSTSNYKKSTAKVQVEAANGWKVKSIQYYNWASNSKGKKIKNGATVKIPAGSMSEVVVTMKKGKLTSTYYALFSRS